MAVQYRSSGLKNTGLKSTGLSGGLHYRRDKFATNTPVQPHLRKPSLKKPGLRQASVPVRGLQSVQNEHREIVTPFNYSVQSPRSISARAQGRANFSMNRLNVNRDPRINPYT